MVSWFSGSSPLPCPEVSLVFRLSFLFTDELKPFWCYNISVYPVLQDRVGKPFSIQAYVREGSMYEKALWGKETLSGGVLSNIQTRLWMSVAHSRLP